MFVVNIFKKMDGGKKWNNRLPVCAADQSGQPTYSGVPLFMYISECVQQTTQ